MNINQKVLQLEKELQELREQVANQEQAKNKTPIGWVPGDGGDYYSIDSDGYIKFDNNNTEWDEKTIEYYKVFQTEGEAQHYAEKMKVERELEKFAKEFVYDEENWDISWDYIDGEVYYTFHTYLKKDSIYFKSKKTAQEAVQAVGEERIKKYYLEVEDD